MEHYYIYIYIINIINIIIKILFVRLYIHSRKYIITDYYDITTDHHEYFVRILASIIRPAPSWLLNGVANFCA